MTHKLSRTAQTIRPFLAMEILEAAQELERQGVSIVHLEVGEPDFPLPPPVEEALLRAVKEGHTHYTHSLGIRPLREAIAAHYRTRAGVDVDPERVIVTSGTSGGLVLLMGLLLEPGDEVLLSDPSYACYPQIIAAFGGVARRVPLDRERGFAWDIERVREAITPRTKAIIINSPANPTATIVDRKTLASLASLGVPLLADEIYQGLEYGERAPSLLEVAEEGFVLDGFSKRYAMTGLRIGWIVAPREVVTPLQRLQQNLFICASSIAQHAAVAAIRHGAEAAESMRRIYEERRGLLLEGLERLALPVPAQPRGAYYCLTDARELGGDSLTLARTILSEAHVGVTPGIDFGPAAEGHLRFSFAASDAAIEEGLRRLERWLARRRP